jgi:hypothetical protein
MSEQAAVAARDFTLNKTASSLACDIMDLYFGRSPVLWLGAESDSRASGCASRPRKSDSTGIDTIYHIKIQKMPFELQKEWTEKAKFIRGGDQEHRTIDCSKPYY